MSDVTLTLVGGPTALTEMDGVRLLTDPTFDPPGEYRLPHITLRKTSAPAVPVDDLGGIDAVLLSHDQHADNLDASGRALVARVPHVFTTQVGATRLGGNARGLEPWHTASLGASMRITATPARHGPAGIEPLSGDVIGFVLSTSAGDAIYVTGDTVWFDGVAEVARRFSPRIVIAFAGAARTRGPFHLTMDTNDVLETAHAFSEATIVPIHCDGWEHFTQTRDDLVVSFRALGVESRLRTLEPAVPTVLRLEADEG
jgi:L-ascorbate metabolism protein UlaG (beta-lactamase superfamily)